MTPSCAPEWLLWRIEFSLKTDWLFFLCTNQVGAQRRYRAWAVPSHALHHTQSKTRLTEPQGDCLAKVIPPSSNPPKDSSSSKLLRTMYQKHQQIILNNVMQSRSVAFYQEMCLSSSRKHSEDRSGCVLSCCLHRSGEQANREVTDRNIYTYSAEADRLQELCLTEVWV